MNARKPGFYIKTIVLYALLALLALACILPFWLMIVNSSRSGVEITKSFSFLPGSSFAENWKALFNYVNLFRGLFNSVIVAVPATILTGYFSAITAYAMEMIKNRVDVLLGPGTNIQRHPLCGRNFEYFSEDPFLSGTMASCIIKGLAVNGVSGTLKHFAWNSKMSYMRAIQ